MRERSYERLRPLSLKFLGVMDRDPLMSPLPRLIPRRYSVPLWPVVLAGEGTLIDKEPRFFVLVFRAVAKKPSPLSNFNGAGTSLSVVVALYLTELCGCGRCCCSCWEMLMWRLGGLLVDFLAGVSVEASLEDIGVVRGATLVVVMVGGGWGGGWCRTRSRKQRLTACKTTGSLFLWGVVMIVTVS